MNIKIKDPCKNCRDMNIEQIYENCNDEDEKAFGFLIPIIRCTHEKVCYKLKECENKNE